MVKSGLLLKELCPPVSEEAEMRATLEMYNQKSIVEVDHDDVGIEEMGDILKQLLLSIGFHPDNVNELFCNDETCPLKNEDTD